MTLLGVTKLQVLHSTTCSVAMSISTVAPSMEADLTFFVLRVYGRWVAQTGAVRLCFIVVLLSRRWIQAVNHEAWSVKSSRVVQVWRP